MASKKINVTTLDFDEIKTNLKDYLRGQDTFQDYDFDGSSMSILLDVLAYNTHYNAIYNNLSINEMFLDSARKRNSVVSRARELGYLPQSAKCSSAIVNITCTRVSTDGIQYYIPAGSPFTTIVNNISYTFYTDSDLLSPFTFSTSYTFSNVRLIEKTNQITNKYTVADGIRYLVQNQYADLSTLTVKVQDHAGSSNIVAFASADNIVDIDGTSKVYWIKELDDNQYELVFGNGVIGYQLTNGNVVNVEYAISSLDAPNGARIFNYTGVPQIGITYSINAAYPATGGSLPEDIESIRFNAPRLYASQNRAVNTNDYKSIIQSNFLEAKSVAVWGGEDNYPPVYGKTFICVKPKTTDYLTSAQKDVIVKDILYSKNMMTVKPVIVDPDYIDIIMETTVYYNDLLTTRTADSIKSVIIDTINNYNTTELQQFDGVFRYSKFSKTLDTSEASIVNNITTLYLRVNVSPKYNISANYTINLLNPIYYSGAAENIVLSNGFYVQGDTNKYFLVDDGVGNMTLFYLDNSGNRVVVDPQIGTVDYAKGIISVNSIKIASLVDDYFTFYIKPSSNDVVSTLHQIVQISMDDLKVSVINDRTATGDLRAGQNYIFTSSRN